MRRPGWIVVLGVFAALVGVVSTTDGSAGALDLPLPLLSTTTLPPPTSVAPTTSTTSLPVPTGPVAIQNGRAVGVPAGDYLLTLTATAPGGPTSYGITQTVGASSTLERVADRHAGPSPAPTSAQVRIAGPSDVLVLVAASEVDATGMTLTPAHWGLLARGTKITTPASADMQWRGVDSDPSMQAADFATLASMHTSVVRLHVEEYLWVPFYNASSATYRATIVRQVQQITALGMTAVVSLAVPGHDRATYVPGQSAVDQLAPDQHSLLFWDDAVSLWGGNPLVAFEPFNEPQLVRGTAYAPDHLSADTLWRDGGRIQDTITTGDIWTAPGEQQLVDRIRNDGATNLILVNGEAWGSNLTYVETNPIDGTNLAYSFHAYATQSGQTTYPSSLDWAVWPLGSPTGSYRYALVLSEFGTTNQDLAFLQPGSQYLTSVINWAQGRNLGWVAHGWYPYDDQYQLLQSYQPLTPNSKGQTVINRL